MVFWFLFLTAAFLSGCANPSVKDSPRDTSFLPSEVSPPPPSTTGPPSSPPLKNGNQPPTKAPHAGPDSKAPVLISEFKLPQPQILTDKQTFSLEELKKTQKPLSLNARFRFSDLKTLARESFENIAFQIKTDCIVDENKNVSQEFTKTINPSVPLLELLPHTLLVSGQSHSVCSFDFKGKNKKNNVYLFSSLLSLPVNLTDSHLIHIVTSKGKSLKKTFPYMLAKNYSDYWLKFSSLLSERDWSLTKLICTSLNAKNGVSASIKNTSSVTPVPAFFATSLPSEAPLKTEAKTPPNAKQTPAPEPYQKCRFLAYNKQGQIKASSLLFYMVPDNFPTPRIRLIHTNNNSTRLHGRILHNMSLEKNQQFRVPL